MQLISLFKDIGYNTPGSQSALHVCKKREGRKSEAFSEALKMYVEKEAT
jgi:hypothetical protein